MSWKLNALGALSARSVQQWSHFTDRIVSGKGIVELVRKMSPQWGANVDIVLAHPLGEQSDTITRIAAVALHDVATWKEHAVTQAAASWSTYAEQQIR